MGLAWFWLFKRGPMYVDFFHFLPRYAIQTTQRHTDIEIEFCEKNLQKGTSDSQSQDLRELINLRHAQKDTTLSDLQVFLNDIFTEREEFQPLPTKKALPLHIIEMLKELHLTHDKLIKHLGE